MSQAVIHGDTVHLAGQVADEPSADVAEQTRQILAKIDALLAEAGTDKSKLLVANVWLSDITTFDEMNTVWDRWVVPGQRLPALALKAIGTSRTNSRDYGGSGRVPNKYCN